MRLCKLMLCRQCFFILCFITTGFLLAILSRHTMQREQYKSRKPGRPIQKTYSFKNNKWERSNVCRPYSTFLLDNDFHLTTFFSRAGNIKIFTHNPDYNFVSREITTKEAFDGNLINTVLNELESDIDLNVIDIGTNVGHFCLATALYGRRCIGIDADESNIQQICASAEIQQLYTNIILVHNALSDKHEQVDIQFNGKGDFGAIYVDADNVEKLKRKSPAFKGKAGNAIKMNTVTLDDLLQLPEIPNFEKVFIKMDVEGLEHKVLLGAKKFFKNIEIRGIILKWNGHIGRKSSALIKRFFSKWGFVPFSLDSTIPLALNNSDKWPYDILWYPFSIKTGYGRFQV